MWPFSKGKLVVIAQRDSSPYTQGVVEIYEHKGEYSYRITGTDFISKEIIKEDAIVMRALVESGSPNPHVLVKSLSNYFNKDYEKWRFTYVNKS